MDKPENNRGIGIVTERDVVSYLGSDLALSLRTQISEIMSSPLITISIANSLKDAIEIMQQKNIRRLPVMDGENIDNKMVGIVTDKDILRAIMKTIPAITSAGQGERTDQTQSGYRFMYESYFTEDSVPKGTNLGV